MEIQLPSGEAEQFAVTLSSDLYRAEERDYKVAVHRVVSRLLSGSAPESPTFLPNLMAFFERRLDLGDLNFDGAEQEEIEKAVAPFYGITNAFINLAGGRYGVNNFIWMPAAVEHELGPPLRDAFAVLVSADQDLSERVEDFRTRLYAIEQDSKEAGVASSHSGN